MKKSKDIQRGYFYDNAVVTDEQLDNVVDSQLGVLDSIEDLPTASSANLGDEYKIGNSFYKCVLEDGRYDWKVTGNAEAVTSYPDLEGKPRIGGTTLNGEMSVDDLGGVEKDITAYQLRNVSEGDECYIVSGGEVYRTTVGALRKPRQEVITINAADWVDGLCTKKVSGVKSDSVIVASPSPDYASVFFTNPFWCSSVGDGTLTFSTNNTPTTVVKMNVIIY